MYSGTHKGRTTTSYVWLSPCSYSAVEIFANVKKTNVSKYSQTLLDTLLMHLSQSFWIWWVWHTNFCAVPPILLCSTSQVSSGWMGSVGAQPFSDFSIAFQSGLSWVLAGHSKTFTELSWSPFFEHTAKVTESSCWKVNLYPVLESRTLWSRISSWMSL